MEEDLLMELCRENQIENSKQLLEEFCAQKDPVFDPRSIADSLLKEALISWFCYRKLKKKNLIPWLWERSQRKKAETFVADFSKLGYVGLEKLISVLPQSHAPALRSLFQSQLCRHCGEILDAFLASTAGALFDPRVFAQDLKNLQVLSPEESSALLQEPSRRERVKQFQQLLPPKGTKGLAGLLRLLRRRKLIFEALYLHVLIEQGPAANIRSEKIAEIARKASMDVEGWKEEWRSHRRNPVGTS